MVYVLFETFKNSFRIYVPFLPTVLYYRRDVGYFIVQIRTNMSRDFKFDFVLCFWF